MENIEKLENEFSNLCHILSNKNLGIQIRHKNEEKTVKDTQEIARAFYEFKKAFVDFRDNGYK